MLTLLLLRHAKAVQPRGDDFLRDLQDKGIADARRLGAYLAARGIAPDFAFVSAANRSRQTFDIVQAALETVPARFEEELFNATAADLRDLLRIVDPAIGTLLIVGHNPGIADAAVILARDGDLAEITRMRNRYAPCGLALLSFDAKTWADAIDGGGRLDLFLLPEDLEG